MDSFKVSLSSGMKASFSRDSVPGLVIMKWAIWSFRLFRDWTARRERWSEREGNRERGEGGKGERETKNSGSCIFNLTHTSVVF
jgi:hypothetical protein